MRSAWNEMAIKCALILILAAMGVVPAIAQVDSSSVPLPTEPGMYVQTVSGLTKVIGQIAEFTRTGSRLVSTATVGIKSAKVNIQLQGSHSQTIVSPQPVFYFVPPKQEAAAGVNAGDFILIRLEEKAHRRQFEIGAAGLFRASSGISLTHQLQILRSEPSAGVYMITPAMELNKGEYALYLARGEGMAAYVYDFGVQGELSVRALQGSRSRPVANVSEAIPPPTDPAGSSANSVGATNTRASEQAVPSASERQKFSQGGVLGLAGADWNQDGVKGVEIIEVSDQSSAQIAGLRKGYVITGVNGLHVGSTQELSYILARLEPGSRVSVAYLYRSNLGWMPQETVAILSK